VSFTSIVKNEVSKLELFPTEKYAELSALITSNGQIGNTIKIVTENASVARCAFTIIKDLYHINSKITVRRGYNFTKNYLYIIEITKNISKILKELTIDDHSRIPKSYLVDDEDTKRAYLRGLFIATGSINDPKTSRYHLEFLVEEEQYAIFINDLLNYFDLKSKYLKRENKYMIYIKEAEKISDFLRVINATQSLLYFEDIRIYRDHKNMTNRLNNCEQANVDKIVITANNQVKDIELIESVGGLDLVDEKVKEAAIYRKKYPDVSLLELSEIISIETGNIITKSGLYHRINKIKSLANKIRLKEE
jgi:cell division protein WhiA